MKTNELMLGDWVLVERYEGIYGGPVWKQAGKVNGIFQEEAEIRFSDDDDDEFIYSYPSDGIDPIPLTPEILEKNGFEDGQFFAELLYREWQIMCDCSHIAMRHEGGWSMDISCKYVHELQHALRLCGIDLDIKL